MRIVAGKPVRKRARRQRRAVGEKVGKASAGEPPLGGTSDLTISNIGGGWASAYYVENSEGIGFHNVSFEGMPDPIILGPNVKRTQISGVTSNPFPDGEVAGTLPEGSPTPTLEQVLDELVRVEQRLSAGSSASLVRADGKATGVVIEDSTLVVPAGVDAAALRAGTIEGAQLRRVLVLAQERKDPSPAILVAIAALKREPPDKDLAREAVTAALQVAPAIAAGLQYALAFFGIHIP